VNFSRAFFVFSCLGLAACGSTGSASSADTGPRTGAAASCVGGVHGKRYTLCAKLTSTGSEGAGASGRRVVAAFDSTSAPMVDRYALRGGSFHVER
jgi:hypothetical protein